MFTADLDALTAPDRHAVGLAAAVPGPAVVALVAAVDHEGLTPVGLRALVVAVEHQIRWLQSRKSAVFTALAATDGAGPADLVELAADLAVPVAAVRKELATARALQSLPATAAGQASGALSGAHVAEMQRLVAGVTDDDDRALLEQAALTECAGLPAKALAAVAEALVTADDPAAADRRHVAAARNRYVSYTPKPDGMGLVEMYAPADACQVLVRTVTRLAERGYDRDTVRRARPDPGAASLDACKADELVGLAHLAAASLDEGGTGYGPLGRVQADVAVVISAPALMGLTQTPAELTGHGPIPDVLARALVADARHWKRWVTEPHTGRLLDVSPHRYRPSAAVREFVDAAHTWCIAPGCRVPARDCQGDHLRGFAVTGQTLLDETAPECGRHHQGFKHTLGVTVTKNLKTGAYTWLRDGRSTTVRPPPVDPEIQHR